VKAEMENVSDDYSLLAIQGPKAVEAMQALSSVDLAAIKYYHFEVADFAGLDNVIISATGYTVQEVLKFIVKCRRRTNLE
jgi:aminomethyltransferase